jgi:NAD(P)-dependent dehydrogenase (short-subunit alcohol dehydrogenase family)
VFVSVSRKSEEVANHVKRRACRRATTFDMKEQAMREQQVPIGTGFEPATTAEEVLEGLDLRDALAIVTGGYSGLGLEISRVLSNAGASVIVPARDLDKAARALAGLPAVEQHALDLADPDSIKAFTRWFLDSGRSVDMLINNAGVMAVPLHHDTRGFEAHLAVNYLGHFDLTRQLWPALVARDGARVISVTSRAYRFSGIDFDDPNYAIRDYEKWAAYGQSMTAKTSFAIELDARANDAGVRAFAVHPGTIATDLSRHLSRTELVAMGAVAEDGTVLHPAGFKTISQGAATTVWAATSPQLEGCGGLYLEDIDVAPLVDSSTDLYGPGVDAWVLDPDAARHLWTRTETLLDHHFADGRTPAAQLTSH